MLNKVSPSWQLNKIGTARTLRRSATGRPRRWRRQVDSTWARRLRRSCPLCHRSRSNGSKRSKRKKTPKVIKDCLFSLAVSEFNYLLINLILIKILDSDWLEFFFYLLSCWALAGRLLVVIHLMILFCNFTSPSLKPQNPKTPKPHASRIGCRYPLTRKYSSNIFGIKV